MGFSNKRAVKLISDIKALANTWVGANSTNPEVEAGSFPFVQLVDLPERRDDGQESYDVGRRDVN